MMLRRAGAARRDPGPIFMTDQYMRLTCGKCLGPFDAPVQRGRRTRRCCLVCAPSMPDEFVPKRIECEGCGVEVIAHVPWTRHCSDRCRQRATHRKEVLAREDRQLTCATCAKAFTAPVTRGPIPRYCSARCRKAKTLNREKTERAAAAVGPQAPQPCLDCGRLYERMGKRRRCLECSPPVAERVPAEPNRFRVMCVECGNPFSAPGPSCSHCSDDCRLKAKRKRSDRSRRALAGPYIKRLITKRSGLSPDEVPESLIEAKRAQVRLQRLLEEMLDEQANEIT